MHWCQYLAIVWSKHLRKRKYLRVNKENSPNFLSLKYLIFILGYSFLMSSLTVTGLKNTENFKIQYNFFYLIPLIFQLYHFYIDGYIWKFSDPLIKQSVLPFIFSQRKSTKKFEKSII